MEIAGALRQIAKNYEERKDSILTEEAAKMSLVAPFISALGYNIFDPTEVIPEFVADALKAKGQRIDFAIKQGGAVTMLIECKCCFTELTQEHTLQLARYFPHVTDAKFGILTNGLEYQIYSDLSEKNVLDPKPFFCFDIRKLSSSDIKTLEQFCKPNFNVSKMLDSATELKYTGEIKRYIAEQFDNPSDQFTKCLIAGIEYPGVVRANVLEAFKSYSKNALKQFMNEKLNERLSSAIKEEETPKEPQPTEQVDISGEEFDDGIVTTPEEIDGFNIVRAILCQYAKVDDIVYRDTKSYCGILYKNNNRTPICRLRFNSLNNLKLGLIGEGNVETIVKLDSIPDIYKYSNELIKALKMHLAGEEEQK